MLHPRWLQLARATGVFVATGWLTAVAVQLTNSDASTGFVMTCPATRRAAGVGLAIGIVWAPLAAWSQGSVYLRATAGLMAGLLAQLTGCYVYFLVWPPQWDPGSTFKIVQLFLATYGPHVLPISAVSGVLASLWAGRVPSPSIEDA